MRKSLKRMFKQGDTVQLKSGGPKMTVMRIFGEGEATVGDEFAKLKGAKKGDVICKWFVGTEPKDDVFPVDALKKAE